MEMKLCENVIYYAGSRAVLQDICLTLTDPVTAVCGETGAGKSTLCDVLMGIRKPSHGTLTVPGRMSCVSRHAAPPEEWTLGRAVRFAAPSLTDDLKARLLSELDLMHDTGLRLKAMTAEKRALSCLVCALAAGPELLIYDDAFTGLYGKQEMLAKMCRLTRELGLPLLMLTSQPGDTGLADRTYRLREGRLL